MTATASGQAVTSTDVLRGRAQEALAACGVRLAGVTGDDLDARTPVTGEALFGLRGSSPGDVEAAVAAARMAFLEWRTTPAPRRGALVKRLAELIAEHKDALATLVTVEAGKVPSEALGEVQEMIDVCDLAVGLSRQLDGRTMPSERPGHRLMETWHPLGVVAVISAFNFPVAVWSWNVALALVCGDPVVWKPSERTPLCALACTALLDRAIAEQQAPPDLAPLVLGGADVGERLVDSPEVALVSATGSTRMGVAVGPRTAARFGRSLLELGGNNAAVVAPSANLDLAIDSILFSAAGTAGQRCTTTRRIILHSSVAGEVTTRLAKAYAGLPIGDPLEEGTLVGPLVVREAYDGMQRALERARADGGEILAGGGRRLADVAPDAYYVEPTLVRMPAQTDLVREETFAPILYALTYDSLDEAIALHNDVPQGLSSSIFTSDQAEAERFIGPDGSDCGIANVNVGTSGAEIGGAFGGEKATGGGRESGSDAWRGYMRRATITVNGSGQVALAQGVRFS